MTGLRPAVQFVLGAKDGFLRLLAANTAKQFRYKCSGGGVRGDESRFCRLSPFGFDAEDCRSGDWVRWFCRNKSSSNSFESTELSFSLSTPKTSDKQQPLMWFIGAATILPRQRQASRAAKRICEVRCFIFLRRVYGLECECSLCI